MTLDPKKLEEWKRRAAALVENDQTTTTPMTTADLDAPEGHVLAMEAVPALIAEVERLRGEPRPYATPVKVMELRSERGVEATAFKPADADHDRLRAEVASLRSLLREVEWADFAWEVDEDYRCCPICGGFRQSCLPQKHNPSARVGHDPECALAAAIRGVP